MDNLCFTVCSYVYVKTYKVEKINSVKIIQKLEFYIRYGYYNIFYSIY